MKTEPNLYEKAISEENIYKAIYSLESYIFEKELLPTEDIEKFNALSDKYNIEKIDEVIKECKKKIQEVFNLDELFDVEVFFKPKKYNEKTKEVEYRPIHSADLITQICLVSLLNVIMFDDAKDKRKLSDISRLLPSNFYGNIPSINVGFLFEPWNRKYQEYSEKAIQAHNQYYKTKKYEHEINLDLKNFFPTINPLFIYNFIIEKWPINTSDTDIKYLKKILEKLLFFNIEIPSEWLSVYYPIEKLDEIVEKSSFYNIGIPQGLPQAYFFGNICMLIIANEIKRKFVGEAFYYVDDSVIYTKSVVENFYTNIKDINTSINQQINVAIKERLNDKIKINNFDGIIDYTIEIHSELDGKSTIAEINSEESLYKFAKPASTISFEIKAASDELEDASLRLKVEAILNAIDCELDSKLKDGNNPKLENNLKLLKRYKKFYTNRLNILKQRDGNEIKEDRIDLFYLKYGLMEAPISSIFFKKLEDDVFNFESKLLIRQLEIDPYKQEEIVDMVKKFEKKFNNKVKRITNHYFSTVLETYIEHQKYKNKAYDYLESKMAKTIESLYKVKKDKKEDVIQSIIKLLDNSEIIPSGDSEIRINNFLNRYRSGYFRFVFLNSSEFIRKIANALISKSFNVSINDSCNLIKLDSRAIDYSELRILMYVRSYGFKTKLFINHTTTILNELGEKLNFEKIDLSLLEVLPVFKIYIKDPNRVDDLIVTHKYVNGIWKNGSKFLHFYTLHNEDHSIALINQCTKITKTIDYLSIKTEDYYILFLACYLHDVSMVLYPNLDNFAESNEKTDLIYSQWKREISELGDVEIAPKTKIKQLILSYYESVNNYFEIEIRDNHHKRSSKFIKEQLDLSFINKPLRKLVADVSEAHCYDAKDVYKLKSKAKHDSFDEKYLMIILRLADLLDMSKDRVSINILRQNINNMPEVSKYHWISHMAIDSCTIKSEFSPIDKETADTSEQNKIKEIIRINIFMNTKLFNSSKKLKCKGLSCEVLKNKFDELDLKIIIGEKENKCDGTNCNSSCKWITDKQKYLFNELIELKQYLDRNSNNIFKTEFEVVLKFENTSILPADYLDIVNDRLEKIQPEK